MYHTHCHLYFPGGKYRADIPLSCSVGDYKSKLQLYRDRRGHSSPLLPPHPNPNPLSLSPPCILILLGFHQTSPPLASSVYCTNASCRWWSHLGVVRDLPLPCLSVQGWSRYSVLWKICPTLNTGHKSLHTVTQVVKCVNFIDNCG